MNALRASVQGSERERTRQLARESRERGQAQAAITAGVQNVSGGIGDIGSALALGIDSRSGKKTTTTDTVEDPFQFNKDKKAAKNAVDITGGQTTDMMSEEEIAKIYEEVYSKFEPIFKKGGVQKTPGKFSHKTNPIDIMQEGAKIGEMTGGEYIFNPKQAKQMQKLAKSGNTDLHKFVKSLLNKPQFK